MLKKYTLLLALLLSALVSFSQNNLKYSPERPQAGDVITISYTPANELLGTKGTVEGMVYVEGINRKNINDLDLKKSGNQYSGKVQTDTADNFVYFSFLLMEIMTMQII